MSKRGPIVKTSLSPRQILQNPLLNKGTAFTQEERDELKLNGLLPCHISSLEEQLERTYKNFTEKRTPLGKYTFLSSLLNRNEILFYLFIQKHLEEMLPYIYTPTVGEASLQFSLIFKQQRGLYLSYSHQDRLEEIFKNAPYRDIDVIVVTDGERILGLGDQGIGGMVIPIGKLSLYTLFGGIHPAKTLPIILDVGTNNTTLLDNKLYIGWRHSRITGEKYDLFIQKFVNAVKKFYPKALLQWEDFGGQNAKKILNNYKEKILSFNDDIQGTAAVALSAILVATKIIKTPLKKHRIVLFGAGSAGLGIAYRIFEALIDQGISEEEALSRIFLIDINGLIHTNQKNATNDQKFFAKKFSSLVHWKVHGDFIGLKEVIINVHPTILIGVSAQAGAFNKEIIQYMAKCVKRPIIFPLSNPTSKVEAIPEEILEWTNGEAIIATGSPFKPVEYKNKIYEISQCNNAYIFPGIGLGSLISESKKISEKMFLEAAKVLAKKSPAYKDINKPLFPPFDQVQKISKEIAIAVALQAIKENIAPKNSLKNLKEKIKEIFWTPQYGTIKKSK